MLSKEGKTGIQWYSSPGNSRRSVSLPLMSSLRRCTWFRCRGRTRHLCCNLSGREGITRKVRTASCGQEYRWTWPHFCRSPGRSWSPSFRWGTQCRRKGTRRCGPCGSGSRRRCRCASSRAASPDARQRGPRSCASCTRVRRAMAEWAWRRRGERDFPVKWRDTSTKIEYPEGNTKRKEQPHRQGGKE